MTDPSTVPAPLTPERIAEISARLVAISSWPWQQTRDIKLGVKLWDRDGHAMFRAIPDVRHSHVSEESPEPQWQHDTDFVRCAPTDIEDLLAHCASLEARCEALEEDKAALIEGRVECQWPGAVRPWRINGDSSRDFVTAAEALTAYRTSREPEYPICPGCTEANGGAVAAVRHLPPLCASRSQPEAEK